MARVFSLLCALVALVTASPLSGNCPTNDFSVDVANFPYAKGDLHPCQYAGTLEAGDAGHNLFFWFFRHKEASKPLAIWIEGGPGSSGLFGLFVLNGPLNVTKVGDDDYTITSKKSFTDDYHVLYLDQPVMTGFSYGGDVAKDMEEGADDFVSFMQKFLETFSDLKANHLLMLGESYAGKFVPLFTQKMLDFNKKADSKTFNVKAMIVNDPYVSPELQRTNMHLVAQGLNILDQSTLDQVVALQQRCQKEHVKDIVKAKDTCYDIMNYIRAMSGNVEAFDARIFDYDWVGQEDYLPMLTTSGKKEEIYKALHVDQSTKEPKFEQMPESVTKALASDSLVDYSAYYQKLIDDKKVPVLVMAGEFDMQDGAITQDLWIKELLTIEDFYFDERRVYYYNNSNGEERVGGYFRGSVSWQETKFTLLTVPKAGHFLDNNNYELAKSVLDDFATLGHLQNVKESDVTDQMCNYMNQCEAHQGFCNGNGQCICNSEGHILIYGADCSHKSTKFYKDEVNSLSKSTTGTDWIYAFHQVVYIPPRDGSEPNYSGDDTEYKSMEFAITSSKAPFSVYTKGNYNYDPSPVNFDAAVKKWPAGKELVIACDMMVNEDGSPGSSFAIEVHGFNHKENQAITSDVSVELRKKKTSEFASSAFIN